MPIQTIITDPQNSLNVKIINDNEESNALIVATRPLKTFENEFKFFTSTVSGIDMNIGRTANFTENIYDGTDNVYWTASIISGGKWTLDSTDQNHTAGGSKSLKYDNGNIGNTVQFLRSNNINLTDYDSLVIWVYVDKDWATADSVEIYGWDSGTSTIVGTSVALENYFNFSQFDIWQQITIPLSDMFLIGESLDSFRIEIIAKIGKSPKIYFDDIILEGIEEIAGTGEFIIEPDLGTWLHVDKVSISFADDYTGIVTVVGAAENATLPGLSYNKILGIAALSSGIIYQRIQNGEILFLANFKQLSDFLQISGAKIANTISDGTNTFITIDIPLGEPVILKSKNNDKLKLLINDDLSGLLLARASITGKSERRE